MSRARCLAESNDKRCGWCTNTLFQVKRRCLLIISVKPFSKKVFFFHNCHITSISRCTIQNKYYYVTLTVSTITSFIFISVHHPSINNNYDLCAQDNCSEKRRLILKATTTQRTILFPQLRYFSHGHCVTCNCNAGLIIISHKNIT